MVRKLNQSFRPHGIPTNARDLQGVMNWAALQFRDLGNYVTALEERIRPSVLWQSMVDRSIGASIPFEVWAVDTVFRDDVGEGDYQVTISALCEGTAGLNEVEFGVSETLTGTIISTGVIPLGPTEEIWVTVSAVISQAKTIVVWIRGANADVDHASTLAVRIGG